MIPLGSFQHEHIITGTVTGLALFKEYDLITPVNVLKCLLYNKINSIFPIAIVKMHNRIIFTLKFKIGSLDLLHTHVKFKQFYNNFIEIVSVKFISNKTDTHKFDWSFESRTSDGHCQSTKYTRHALPSCQPLFRKLEYRTNF